MRRAMPFVALVLLTISSARAADDEAGFTPLFNGKDLSGWVPVNVAPNTFTVGDRMIDCTGVPTGVMRTDRQYENFVLEMEWMHENKKEVGNSGLFVWGDPIPAVGAPYTRGIEVQVLVNLEYRDKKSNAVTATSHGDLFSIWGATCKPDRPHPLGWARCLPSENRAKGGGEWNHYKVTANNGVIKLEVNGKEVSGVSACNPRKGYLALESEGAECHFKNIKVKELPSTNPKPDEVAQVAEGHKLLFDGLDLDGWRGDTGSWKAGGGVLRATGTGELATEAKFGKVEVLFDWRLAGKATGEPTVAVGGTAVKLAPKAGAKNGAWAREVIRVEDAGGPVTIKPVAGLELMSVFVRELK